MGPEPSASHTLMQLTPGEPLEVGLAAPSFAEELMQEQRLWFSVSWLAEVWPPSLSAS